MILKKLQFSIQVPATTAKIVKLPSLVDLDSTSNGAVEIAIVDHNSYDLDSSLFKNSQSILQTFMDHVSLLNQ